MPVVHCFTMQQRTCYLCGGAQLLPDEQWHRDHVVPKARGGGDHDANRAWAHGLCNMWKGARLLSPELVAEITKRRRVELFIELG